MTREETLRAGRAVAEAGMTDVCVVRRPSEDQVYDRETGQYVTPEIVVYPTPEHLDAGNPGRCRLQSVRAQAANPNAGELVFTVERVELQLPFGTTFKVGDVAEFTRSATNPDLVSEKYRIVGLGRKTHATAQRFDVEVLS